MNSAVSIKKEPTSYDDPVELMRLYKRTGNMEVRNQLVLHYMDSVKKTVMSMRSILPGNMQYDDFINQGVLALIDCIDKYQFDRGASFDTYIYKRLRGSVLSYMRKQSWLPYRVRAARRNIMQEQERMTAELGREPTNEELAERLQMSQKELDKYLVEISNGEMYSFEELLENASHVVEQLSETYDDTGMVEPEGKLLKNELRQTLVDAIESLPMRERQVITLCYYENLNLREIGEVLGISQQRASCARSSGLAKLKKKISEYMNGKEPEIC